MVTDDRIRDAVKTAIKVKSRMRVAGEFPKTEFTPLFDVVTAIVTAAVLIAGAIEGDRSE